MPRRTTKTITLTTNQQAYVLQNHKRMSTAEMGRNLQISQAKVWYNMQLMGLQPTVTRTKPSTDFATPRGYFDVKKYAKVFGI